MVQGFSDEIAATRGMSRFRDPTRYIPDPDLMAAVQVAALLRQPLLLTGDPGTGKSQLADWVGATLKWQVIRYTAKSTSTAGDLLYRFDHVREFRDSQRSAEMPAKSQYLTFQALGRAIALTYPSDHPDIVSCWNADANQVPGEASLEYREPTRSVVLVDEIDKAPRDVPNDLLAEFDLCEFPIPEIGVRLRVQNDLAPIVIATSNSEKALPDAFLRRCVFYNITMPRGQRLREILARQFPDLNHHGNPLIDDAVELFDALQKTPPELLLRKRPSVPELLGAISVFAGQQVNSAADMLNPVSGKAIDVLQRYGLKEGLNRVNKATASILLTQVVALLFKTRDDQDAARSWLGTRWGLTNAIAGRQAD